MNTQEVQIKCPTCATQLAWSPQNPYRPFCSEKCRLIDLGEWLSEKNVIPGTETGSNDGIEKMNRYEE